MITAWSDSVALWALNSSIEGIIFYGCKSPCLLTILCGRLLPFYLACDSWSHLDLTGARSACCPWPDDRASLPRSLNLDPIRSFSSLHSRLNYGSTRSIPPFQTDPRLMRLRYDPLAGSLLHCRLHLSRFWRGLNSGSYDRHAISGFRYYALW